MVAAEFDSNFAHSCCYLIDLPGCYFGVDWWPGSRKYMHRNMEVANNCTHCCSNYCMDSCMDYMSYSCSCNMDMDLYCYYSNSCYSSYMDS